MIEVQMREEEMDAPCAAPHELGAEGADARAGVEYQRLLVVERDLDARCVAAVRDRARTGRRYRTAASPDREAHQTRQKIATIPTNSSEWAYSGNAVTSTSRSTPSVLVIR